MSESFSPIAPVDAGCRASLKHPVFKYALDRRDVLFVIEGGARSSSAPDLSPWGRFD
ncbi:MAG: hypothetical protein ACPGLY_23495 [Rubripirellula sp.]